MVNGNPYIHHESGMWSRDVTSHLETVIGRVSEMSLSRLCLRTWGRASRRVSDNVDKCLGLLSVSALWHERLVSSRLVSTMNILEPNLAGVTASAKSTNSPNLVQIGYEMASPRDVWRNVTVLWLSCPTFFFFPLSRPAHRSQFHLVKCLGLVSVSSLNVSCTCNCGSTMGDFFISTNGDWMNAWSSWQPCMHFKWWFVKPDWHCTSMNGFRSRHNCDPLYSSKATKLWVI